MANIFETDVPASGSPKVPLEPERKRSKHREQLTSFEIGNGKRRLADQVEQAFSTLDEAMKHADHSTAIKAAQIVLDRAGFGPRNTIDVNTTHIDLTELTREQLAERAQKLAARLRDSKSQPLTIDVTVVEQAGGGV